MICRCGARYPDEDKHCRHCGARNYEYKPPEPKQQPTNQPETDHPFNPWDAFPGKGPPPEQNPDWQQNANRSTYPGNPNSQYPPWNQNNAYHNQDQHEHPYHRELARKANIAAIISLVCGIFGNIIAGPIFGPIAIFQGRKAKKLGYPGGKATAGIVLGVIAVVFWVLAMIFLLYIIPTSLPQLVPYLDSLFPA